LKAEEQDARRSLAQVKLSTRAAKRLGECRMHDRN
jgi:hypothetical protein